MPEEDVNKEVQYGFNETARRYWNAQSIAAPEMLEVAPMGGCGFSKCCIDIERRCGI